jgi:hypothetical protein
VGTYERPVFPGVGLRTAWEDRISRYTETAEIRAEEFGSHFDDVVLDLGLDEGIRILCSSH